jgi:uncharacterized protein
MARLLLFVVLAFLVWLAVRTLRGSGDRDVGRGDAPRERSAEPVAQCAWCGAHAPAADAPSLPDGRVYCSDAHRDQARLAAASSDRPGS